MLLTVGSGYTDPNRQEIYDLVRANATQEGNTSGLEGLQSAPCNSASKKLNTSVLSKRRAELTM
jgi:hypothetical protein